MDNVFVAIVDGTGDWDDDDYQQSMAHSFCVQIASSLGLHVGDKPIENYNCRYERGPSFDGMRMIGRAERAADFLYKARTVKGGSKARLAVAGYSRGASAVIMAAERLAKRTPAIDIDAMFLFDPVARHPYWGGTMIPANVKEVWKVHRLLDPKAVAEYDNLFARLSKPLADSRALQVVAPATHGAIVAAHYVASDWSHPMRPGFGFTALKYLGSGRGARGGVRGIARRHGRRRLEKRQGRREMPAGHRRLHEGGAGELRHQAAPAGATDGRLGLFPAQQMRSRNARRDQ